MYPGSVSPTQTPSSIPSPSHVFASGGLERPIPTSGLRGSGRQAVSRATVRARPSGAGRVEGDLDSTIMAMTNGHYSATYGVLQGP